MRLTQSSYGRRLSVHGFEHEVEIGPFGCMAIYILILYLLPILLHYHMLFFGTKSYILQSFSYHLPRHPKASLQIISMHCLGRLKQIIQIRDGMKNGKYVSWSITCPTNTLIQHGKKGQSLVPRSKGGVLFDSNRMIGELTRGNKCLYVLHHKSGLLGVLQKKCT